MRKKNRVESFFCSSSDHKPKNSSQLAEKAAEAAHDASIEAQARRMMILGSNSSSPSPSSRQEAAAAAAAAKRKGGVAASRHPLRELLKTNQYQEGRSRQQARQEGEEEEDGEEGEEEEDGEEGEEEENEERQCSLYPPPPPQNDNAAATAATAAAAAALSAETRAELLFGNERLRVALDSQRQALSLLAERAGAAEREARGARAEAAGARAAAERAEAAALAVSCWTTKARSHRSFDPHEQQQHQQQQQLQHPHHYSAIPLRSSAENHGGGAAGAFPELKARTALLFPRAPSQAAGSRSNQHALTRSSGSGGGASVVSSSVDSSAHKSSFDAMEALLSERTAAAFWG